MNAIEFNPPLNTLTKRVQDFFVIESFAKTLAKKIEKILTKVAEIVTKKLVKKTLASVYRAEEHSIFRGNKESLRVLVNNQGIYMVLIQKDDLSELINPFKNILYDFGIDTKDLRIHVISKQTIQEHVDTKREEEKKIINKIQSFLKEKVDEINHKNRNTFAGIYKAEGLSVFRGKKKVLDIQIANSNIQNITIDESDHELTGSIILPLTEKFGN